MRVAQNLLGGERGLMFLVRHLQPHGSVTLCPFTSSEFHCEVKSGGGRRDGGATKQVSQEMLGGMA